MPPQETVYILLFAAEGNSRKGAKEKDVSSQISHLNQDASGEMTTTTIAKRPIGQKCRPTQKPQTITVQESDCLTINPGSRSKRIITPEHMDFDPRNNGIVFVNTLSDRLEVYDGDELSLRSHRWLHFGNFDEVAVDPRTGNIFIPTFYKNQSTGQYKVEVYSEGLEEMTAIWTKYRVNCVCVDDKGYCYMGSESDKKVHVLDSKFRCVESVSFESPGALCCHFSTGIVFGLNENRWTVNPVERQNSIAAAITVPPVDGGSFPQDITCDPATQDPLMLICGGFPSVLQTELSDLRGKQSPRWTSTDIELKDFVDNVNGICIDPIHRSLITIDGMRARMTSIPFKKLQPHGRKRFKK